MQAKVIEGVQHDEALLVVEEADRSYMIVKGAFDNVVVELSEEGWHELAAIATEQAIRRELTDGNEEDGVPIVVSMLRRAMREAGMPTSDGARLLRIDREAFGQVIRGEASLPDSLLPQVAKAFGVPWTALVHAQQSDRRSFPQMKDVAITISGRLTRRESNRPVRRKKRSRS